MNKGTDISELLSLFEDVVAPEDVIFSFLSSEVTNLLIKERLKRNLNQSEFASLLGIRQSQVSQIENGECNCSLKKLAQYAAKLDLNISITAYNKREVSSRTSACNFASGKSFTRIITSRNYRKAEMTNKFSKMEAI